MTDVEELQLRRMRGQLFCGDLEKGVALHAAGDQPAMLARAGAGLQAANQ